MERIIKSYTEFKLDYHVGDLVEDTNYSWRLPSGRLKFRCRQGIIIKISKEEPKKIVVQWIKTSNNEEYIRPYIIGKEDRSFKILTKDLI